MEPLVYWEAQQAALCGRHAINNLLQGPFFTEVDLAAIAAELDAHERAVLVAGGASPDDVAAAFAAGSLNVDDSGNFSISVLRAALQRVRGLQLEQTPALVARALATPDAFDAYLLNRDDHWYAVRRLPTAGGSPAWFNLNSLLRAPELISEFFLSAYLTQLKADGYSIFVVTPPGGLPPPVAPGAAHRYPAATLHSVGSILAARGGGDALRRSAAKRARDDAAHDPQLAAAPAASLAAPPGGGRGGGGGWGAGHGGGGGGGGDAGYEAQLAAALSASLADAAPRPPPREAAAAVGGRGGAAGAAAAASVSASAAAAAATAPRFSGAGNRLGGDPPASAPAEAVGDGAAAVAAASRRPPPLGGGPGTSSSSSSSGGGGAAPPPQPAGGGESVADAMARLGASLPPEPPSPLPPPQAAAAAAAAGGGGAAAAAERTASGSSGSGAGERVARVQLRLPPSTHPLLLPQPAAAAPLSPGAATRQRRFRADDSLCALFDWAQLCWLEAYGCHAAAAAAGAAFAACALPFELVAPAAGAGGARRLSREHAAGGATVGSAGLAPSASLTLRLASS
jgi:ataxin-3